jgi:hypothetical protein
MVFRDGNRKTGERFAPVLAAWNADSRLGQGAFHDRYLDFGGGIHAVDDLRRAAALSARATTFNEMADAAEHFATAVRTIATRQPSWPPVIKRLEERANEAIDQGKVVLAAQSQSYEELRRERFVTDHLADAQAAADRLHVPVEYILALSGMESTWGDSRFAKEDSNFLGLMHKHNTPGDFDHALKNPNREMWKFGSYAECLDFFVVRLGKYVNGVTDPKKFAKILQDSELFGIDPDTNKPKPEYVKDFIGTVRGVKPVIARIDEHRRA